MSGVLSFIFLNEVQFFFFLIRFLKIFEREREHVEGGAEGKEAISRRIPTEHRIQYGAQS